MVPRSGPGSCVSNVPLLFLHFGHQSWIIGSSAPPSHGLCVTAVYTPLCRVWRSLCDQWRIPLLLWLQKDAERFQSNQPVWLLIKANIRMTGDTSPSLENIRWNNSWADSHPPLPSKRHLAKQPLYSGSTSKSALMNVTLIGVLIGSNWYLMSGLFVIFHSQTDDLRLVHQ